jgi:hypothetical protein
VRFKVKSFLPVLLAMSFFLLVGLHVLLLVIYCLGMSIGNEFEGLYLLLWQLAAGTTVIAAVLVLVRPRWIPWSLLVLSYSLSATLTVIQTQEAAQERREMDQRLAPERLAENRRYLESALIKADCADVVTLTLIAKTSAMVAP